MGQRLFFPIVIISATQVNLILASPSAKAGPTAPQDGLTFVQYLLGIAVAVAVFLIREGISHTRNGLRFRKRIAKDIKLTMENYSEHLPKLNEQETKLAEDIKNLGSGDAKGVKLAPIWSGEFSILPQLYDNSAHLNPEVFQQLVQFYDVGERLNEIRKAYNSVLQQVIVSGKPEIRSLYFLNKCLTSMRRNYRDLIETGCDGLILMSNKHWWLDCDVARCRDLKSGLNK